MIRSVCFYVSLQKMSDRFLEQQIDITFCVKLGKNESDTCTLLSEAYEEKVWMYASVLSSMNGSKRVIRTWKMKEVVIQYLTKPMKMLKR